MFCYNYNTFIIIINNYYNNYTCSTLVGHVLKNKDHCIVSLVVIYMPRAIIKAQYSSPIFSIHDLLVYYIAYT